MHAHYYVHTYLHCYSTVMDEESDVAETGDIPSTEVTPDTTSTKTQDLSKTVATTFAEQNLNPQSEYDAFDPLLNKPEDSEEDKIIDPLLSTDESPTITTADDPTHQHDDNDDDDDIDDDIRSNSFEHLSPLSDDMQPSSKGFREVLGTVHDYM